ncbi:MAG: hypothetical protein JST58_17370 [Bacteroidetes bacterium]|nr:hypothetical protein [Bacteroidota bacterium]
MNSPSIDNITKVLKNASSSETPSQEWIKIKNDDFSNAMVEMYLVGKEKGKKEYAEFKIKVLNKNLDIAKGLSVDFLKSLNAHDIKSISIHLKILSLEVFEAAFIIPAETYFSNSFAKAVELSKEFKGTSENIEVIYKFMPFSDDIDYDILNAEGFVYSYI